MVRSEKDPEQLGGVSDHNASSRVQPVALSRKLRQKLSSLAVL